MVKINGVSVVEPRDSKKRIETKPSINEILDRMQSNYDTRINEAQSNFQNEKNSSSENFSTTHASNSINEKQSMIQSLFNFQSPNENLKANQPPLFNDKFNDNNNNLLLSVLPMLLSNNKSGLGMKNSQDIIFKELLKTSSNPRLVKMLEILPKMMNKNSFDASTNEQSEESKKNAPKIDAFTKTTEYVDE